MTRVQWAVGERLKSAVIGWFAAVSNGVPLCHRLWLCSCEPCGRLEGYGDIYKAVVRAPTAGLTAQGTPCAL